jgi:alpha-L-rhamnosidase
MRVLLYLLAILPSLPLLAQELNVPKPQYVPNAIGAKWITHPGLTGGEPAVVLFRKIVDLPQKPSKLVVNVSADNKYTLYVNGRQVCFGPQLSDIRHWRYETVDLAPYLQPGRNVVVAEVVNFGPDRFFGMQSVKTAFLMNQVEAPAQPEQTLSTGGPFGWETLRNRGLTLRPVRWRVRREERDITGGFYAANPTDSLNAAFYPWGWQTGEDINGDWVRAVFCENASAFGGGFAWLLEPRNTPLQTQRTERIERLAKASDGSRDAERSPAEFLQNKPVLIPAYSKKTFLLDNKVLTTGYPELKWAGGDRAVVKIGYAENLFVPGTPNKVNRDQVDGMQFVGIQDVILGNNGTMSGQPVRTFRPTWLRTFRYVQIEVTTQNEPLTLHDFYNVYTASPVPVKAKFAADDPDYAKVFALCQRTAELCTQDYFLSDAYYETMQYVGDSKVHNLTWLALTGNDRHVRNALEQFHYSRLWDGNLTSCYPLRATFVHPTYSVIWVDMLWDYLLYSGDKAFARQFVPGIRQTMTMFDGLIAKNGIAGASRWDHFIDWYRDSKRGGLAPGQDGSNSAVVTLHYVYALQNAARLFEALGEPAQAAAYRKRADDIKRLVYAACYDARRGLMAERPTKDYFDQHTNIMAVLTDAVPPLQQKALLERTMADSTLGEATYYYRFYLLEAIHKTKAEALLEPALRPWKDLLPMGLSTTPERFESESHPTRSECHPWSTAPAYAFFSTVAGIRPAESGFQKIIVSPNFGELKTIEGTYPHPMGELVFKLERGEKNKLTARLVLPAGVSGTLRWPGKPPVPLKAGEQTIKL